MNFSWSIVSQPRCWLVRVLSPRPSGVGIDARLVGPFWDRAAADEWVLERRLASKWVPEMGVERG